MHVAAMVALCLAGSVNSNDNGHQNLPDEFQGVWIITECGGSAKGKTFNCEGAEIIICEDRVITADKRGRTMLGSAEILAMKPTLKAKVVPGKSHGGEDAPGWCLMKSDGDELVFAWSPPTLDTINENHDSEQAIYRARKRKK